MKVARNRVVAPIVFIVGSLVLVIATGCSLEKQTMDDSTQKDVEGPPEKISFVANQFCSACHYGFSDEELARTHEKVGIGCERCHGESERHRSDENNITPPEIMYPKAKINPTCMMCHPRHEISNVTSHNELLSGAKTVFDSADAGGYHMYCTDCHARQHRINVRTIRWNKETGELMKE
jgi:hypothetical protein